MQYKYRDELFKKKAEELLSKYHTPNTWVEYYGNAVQILNIDGKYIINNTEA